MLTYPSEKKCSTKRPMDSAQWVCNGPSDNIQNENENNDNIEDTSSVTHYVIAILVLQLIENRIGTKAWF